MTTTLRAGDIVRDADGKVSKVLVVDDAAGTIHVRFYEGAFADNAAVAAALAAGPLGWTIGHAPMSLEGFDKGLELVTNIPASEEELEGYRYYVEAMGAAPAKPKEGLLTKLARLLGGST